MNAIDEALASVKQAQQTTLIQLQTFLRSRSRENAARLDAAIEDQNSVIELVSGHRRDFLAKTDVHR